MVSMEETNYESGSGNPEYSFGHDTGYPLIYPLIATHSRIIDETITDSTLVTALDTQEDAATHARSSPKAKGIKSSKRSPSRNRFQDSWLLEYLALALSIACLVAIFAILFYFHNKILNDWHFGLSINTILSILGTALKGASLLATSSALGQLKWTWYSSTPQSLRHLQTFDDASRGPLGALLLPWHTPSLLNTLGSFVMIVALGSDAAIQASTSQPLRPSFSAAASIPVANTYDAYYPSGGVDPLLADAIYNGIFSADNTSTRAVAGFPISFSGKPNTITPFCDTGNCTFDSYSSLAVKHKYLNMSEAVQYSFENNGSLKVATLVVSPEFNLSITMARDEGDSYNIDTEANITSTYSIPSDLSDPIYIPKSSYNQGNLTLAEVYIMGGGVYPSGVFSAFRCNLDFGLQMYTASIYRGQFVETPGDFIRGNWTFQFDTNTTSEIVVPEDTNKWLLRTVMSEQEHQVPIKYFSWTSAVTGIHGYFTSEKSQTSGDNLATVVYNMIHWSMGVDPVFDSIAQSITHYLRTASGQVANGTAVSQEQYIRVDWPWLVVPLVLVVSNTIFVLIVRAWSRRLELPSWRNSVLALLFSDTSNSMAQSTDREVDTNRDHVLIGPTRSVETIRHLDEWAETKPAILRRIMGDGDQDMA
ncbi:hypothetical protein GGR52DRAFT_536157 [Hypoxylon sp. FL1284]|nr:hypothetical protein GGR52DRAFT_536157 [Hypoxylon sp. FL1284]